MDEYATICLSLFPKIALYSEELVILVAAFWAWGSLSNHLCWILMWRVCCGDCATVKIFESSSAILGNQTNLQLNYTGSGARYCDLQIILFVQLCKPNKPNFHPVPFCHLTTLQTVNHGKKKYTKHQIEQFTYSMLKYNTNLPPSGRSANPKKFWSGVLVSSVEGTPRGLAVGRGGIGRWHLTVAHKRISAQAEKKYCTGLTRVHLFVNHTQYKIRVGNE